MLPSSPSKDRREDSTQDIHHLQVNKKDWRGFCNISANSGPIIYSIPKKVKFINYIKFHAAQEEIIISVL